MDVQKHLPPGHAIVWAVAAVVSFHLAYEIDALRGLIIGFLFCLIPLAGLKTNRQAFYVGLGIGFALFAPQLRFFWTIFQGAAIALWLVLAFWIGVFVLLSRQAVRHFGRKGLVVIPILWLGLEFFRSELYYLRFSWLTPGYVFSGTPLAEALGMLGVYGIGALFSSIAASAWSLSLKPCLTLLGVVMAAASFFGTSLTGPSASKETGIEAAGVQLEFPDEDEVLAGLEQLARTQTNASLWDLRPQE